MKEAFVPTSKTEIKSVSLGKKDRILFLDSVRGIALLGILIITITSRGTSYMFYDKMDLSKAITGPNLWVWVVEMGFFQGTMGGLFSILFGAGACLLLQRLEKQHIGLEPADIYFRRLLWLMVFGMINAFLFLWPGDILYSYALLGLVLFPFRNLSPRMLFGLAFLLIAFSTIRENKSLYNGKQTIMKGKTAEALEKKTHKLTAEQRGDLEKYKEFKEEFSSAGYMNTAKEDISKVQGKSYLEIFKLYFPVNMNIQSVHLYKNWPSTLLFFFIGIALFKSGFLEGRLQLGLYVVTALTGMLVSLVFNYWLLSKQYGYRFDEIAITENIPFTIYQLRRVLQTMGYLSLFIILYKVEFFKRLMDIFAPVGQMAFTNYLMQSIITASFFFGFDLYGRLERFELYYVVAVIWVFQIAFSHIWLRYFYFGPFEWVWRALTYLKKPVFLKKKGG